MIAASIVFAALEAGRKEAAAWRIIEFHRAGAWLVTDDQRDIEAETPAEFANRFWETNQFDSEAKARGFIEYRAMEKAIEAALKGK